MEKDDAAEGEEFPQDEVEKKIATLEAKIASVSKNEDRKILWGAAGLVVFIVAFKLLQFNPIVVIAVVPTVVFGGIAMVIYENIRKKRKILVEHGLKCGQCGHLPHFINASGLYYSRRCPKCRAPLDI